MTRGMAWPGERAAWVAVLLAAVVLMAYRFWLVGHLGITLFYDEAQYWDWSRDPAWGYYSKPPMIAWLIALGTALAGSGLLGVKLVPMLLYPATAFAVGWLARCLHPRAGPVAALIVLCLPITGLMGLFASTDAPLLFFWSLAALALWQAQTTDRLGWWAALGVACGLGLLSKYTTAAFAASAIVVLWAVPGPRRGLLRPGPWVAAAVAAALLVPNLLWNAQMGFPTLQHTADITTRASRTGGFAQVLEFLAGQVAILGPLGAWWAVRGLMMIRRRAWAAAPASPGALTPIPTGFAPGTSAFLLALTLPLLGVSVVQAFHAHAHINWAAPAHIGSVLLIALALHTPGGTLRRGALAWLVASNLVLIGLVAHASGIAQATGHTLNGKLDVFSRMRAWDEAFRQVRAQLPELEQAAGRPIVLVDDRLLLTEAAYQWRDLGIRPVAWNPDGSVHDHYELTTRFAPRPGDAVLLLWRGAAPAEVLSSFGHVEPLRPVRLEAAPGRVAEILAYRVSEFRGYTDEPAATPAPGRAP